MSPPASKALSSPARGVEPQSSSPWSTLLGYHPSIHALSALLGSSGSWRFNPQPLNPSTTSQMHFLTILWIFHACTRTRDEAFWGWHPSPTKCRDLYSRRAKLIWSHLGNPEGNNYACKNRRCWKNQAHTLNGWFNLCIFETFFSTLWIVALFLHTNSIEQQHCVVHIRQVYFFYVIAFKASLGLGLHRQSSTSSR